MPAALISSASNDNLKDPGSKAEPAENGNNRGLTSSVKVNKSLSSSHLSSGNSSSSSKLHNTRPSSSRSARALNALSDDTESEEDEESSPVIDKSNNQDSNLMISNRGSAAPTAPLNIANDEGRHSFSQQ